MSEYQPIVNPVTGLEHTEMPLVKRVPQPKSLLFVGNSFFFFNNGVHRFLRRLLQKASNPPKVRMNMVAINGSCLSWHDLESYFRPHAISSYTMNANNEVVFRDPHEQLWDSVLLLDNSQGPIHPVLGADFKRAAKLDVEICHKHNATPIFISTWCYVDKPEMTAALSDATTKVANDNNSIVVPVGLAFAFAKKNRPGLELNLEDKRHPNPAGAYLFALVIAQTLFDIDVMTIDFDCEIDHEIAFYLRGIAKETVNRFFQRT